MSLWWIDNISWHLLHIPSDCATGAMTLWGDDRNVSRENEENFLMGNVIKLPLD